MSSSSKGEGKKKGNPWLPIMGLALAGLLGVTAYFLAPALLDFGVEQSATLRRQVRQFERDPGGLPEKSFEYVTALFLWLIFMAVLMFIAALAVGPDPEKEAVQTLPPSPSDKKAVAKDLRRQIKAAKKRERERQKRTGKKK